MPDRSMTVNLVSRFRTRALAAVTVAALLSTVLLSKAAGADEVSDKKAEAQQVANTAWPRLFAKRRDLKVPDGFSPDALP